MVRRAPLALATAVLLGGCAAPASPPPTVLVTSTTFVPPPPVEPQVAESQSPLDAVVSAVTAAYGGEIGVAVAGVGQAGFIEPSPAWSTIKVPIAIAALNTDPAAYGDAVSAITVSDNDAAQRLYALAGAEGVNNVLAFAGVDTHVNTAPLRPEFSTFGQTMLSVGDEAQLAGGLACVPGSADVLNLMGQVDPSQSYGLGTVPGALFKGGWGPDPAGQYHVRQLGLLPSSGGFVAAALTAVPADGTYATGQAMLNLAALELSTLLPTLPVAPCQA